MESCFGYILFSIYFILIPAVCNIMWQDDKSDKSFIKWYFTKSYWVNWLGYFTFIIMGLGCTIWILLSWIFEFLFLNKDCSHIVCKDLKKYNKEKDINEDFK